MGRPPLNKPNQRFTITLDLATVKIIKRIQRTVPEASGISAAIRYLARWHESTTQKRPDDMTS
jgi:hypothetical protein